MIEPLMVFDMCRVRLALLIVDPAGTFATMSKEMIPRRLAPVAVAPEKKF